MGIGQTASNDADGAVGSWRFCARDADGAVCLELYDGERRCSWREWLDALLNAPAARQAFNAALVRETSDAFRWECPALTASTLDQPFECMLIPAPELDRPADAQPFAAQLEKALDAAVTAFPNLGGDATLVVPTHAGDISAYAHIGAFVRRAPESQRDAFWRCVADCVQARIGDRPFWLSTAGDGVAWLHVRLDASPKYYRTRAYRQAG